jgi:glycerol-3-phosphate cytidylyltransferase-like family protein
MTDDCVLDYKGKKPLMSFRQRRKIVQELKMVHTTMIQETFEFPHKVMRLKFFHGKNFLIFDSAAHCRDGADFCFPYMSNISSTLKKEGL